MAWISLVLFSNIYLCSRLYAHDFRDVPSFFFVPLRFFFTSSHSNMISLRMFQFDADTFTLTQSTDVRERQRDRKGYRQLAQTHTVVVLGGCKSKSRHTHTHNKKQEHNSAHTPTNLKGKDIEREQQYDNTKKK